MSAFVTVHQLQSGGGSFLNVMNEPGQTGVWGSSYNTNTILAIDGINFNLISFDSKAYYDEWFENNKTEFDYFYIVTKNGVEMYYAKQ
jgi:hypothetical protein